MTILIALTGALNDCRIDERIAYCSSEGGKRWQQTGRFEANAYLPPLALGLLKE